MESTPPSKSQPLHNFDLPNLKWNTDGNASNNNNNNGGSSSSSLHRRRPFKSPSPRPDAPSSSPVRRDSVSAPPPPRRRSPARESQAPGESAMKRSPVRGESFKQAPISRRSSLVGGDPERLFRSGQSSTEAEASKKKKKKKSSSKGAPLERRESTLSKNFAPGSLRGCASGEKKKEPISKKVGSPVGLGISDEKKNLPEEPDLALINRTKILIKIPGMNSKPAEEVPPAPPQIPQNAEKNEVRAEEEQRTWDLRPRKPKRKTPASKPGVESTSAPAKTAKAEKSGGKEPKRGGGGGGGGEKEKEKKDKKEKKKLSICIPLSKEEIEEDIYAFTGTKPARRPKKRAKNIQKDVDAVFPGLWLLSITPESYKVSESSLKG